MQASQQPWGESPFGWQYCRSVSSWGPLGIIPPGGSAQCRMGQELHRPMSYWRSEAWPSCSAPRVARGCMRMSVFASTEFSRAGLGRTLPRGGATDVMTTSKLLLRCGNEGPDLVLLGVDEHHRGRPFGIEFHDFASLGHGMPTLPHHLCRGHRVGKTEGDRPLPQRSSESVPILEEADLSALMPREKGDPAYGNAGPLANQIAHRLGATRKTRENHRHRICFTHGVRSQPHAVHAAFHRGTFDNEYAPIRPFWPDLPSSA